MSEKMKAKVGLLLSAMAMMSFLAPAAVMAAMVQQFPDTNVSLIQMIITIPSLISIPLGLVAARLAKTFYKKALIVFGTCCYLVGGILPYFLHGSVEMILGCSCIIGVGMGIAMTAITALICEFFQGEERGGMLVQRCINLRVICTCLLRHRFVVVSQQCHRIASFLRLALTQNPVTYYFEINAMLY